MPISISGTQITFNDSTTQTTGLSTTTVLNATASATVGDVGTYALLGRTTSAATTQGTTYAGSSLRFMGFVRDTTFVNTYGGSNQWVGNQGTPSGTWRAISSTPSAVYCGGDFGAGLFLRIS